MPRKKRKHILNINNQNNGQDMSNFIVDLKKISEAKEKESDILFKKNNKENKQNKRKLSFKFKIPKFRKYYFKNLLVWPLVFVFLKIINIVIYILRLPYVIYKKNIESLFKKNKRNYFHFKIYKKIKNIMKKPNFLLAKLKLTKEKKEKIDANNIAKWPDKELKNPFYNKNKTEDKNEKNKVVNSQVNTDKQASGFKAVSGFILVLLILILPFKVLSYYNVFNLNILESKLNLYSQSAMESLMLASDKAKTLEMDDASNYFSLAENDFLAAQAEVENIDKFIFDLAALAKNPKYKMASQTPFFLEAGLQISKTGEELGLALDSFLKNKDNKNVNLVASLENFIVHGKKATISAQSLNETINKIDFSLLPTKYQAEFLEIKDTSKVLSEGLKESVILAETLKSFMGIESDKRYLFIFQNNSELRASGGFMGSYALIDISRGKIKNLEVPKGGTYDTEAGLTLNIESPEPLWLVSPRWYFWDANWWPDWKKSAENISWFYEKSAGPTVDGVISFTPRVIEDLLEILGPIDMMQEYGVIITSENFWETVQSIVEEKTVLKTTEEGKIVEEKNTEPKKIIGDMMNKLINELPERLTTEKLIKMMSSIENNLQEKHILFYFSDDKMQAQAEKNSWAGRIKDTQYDYLLVVNTNIAGQKTDRAIKQDIVHYSQVQDDGSIVNTVKIVRTHQGVKRQEFTGVRNVNWMRVYVPKGSTFISASGFEAPNNKYFSYPSDQAKKLDSLEAERQALIDQVTNTKIYQESNKTVFANWTMVDPGESVEIILKYKLPFNFNSIEPKYNWLDNIKHKILGKDPNLVPYSLLVQKQPGSINNTLVSHLNIKSADYKALWSSENINSLQNNSWNFNSNLKTDKYFGALWQQINTDK